MIERLASGNGAAPGLGGAGTRTNLSDNPPYQAGEN